MTPVEKVNHLFNAHKDVFEGSYHNALWQVIVNNSLGNASAAFETIDSPYPRQLIIALAGGGYIPTSTCFKDCSDEVKRRVIAHLNQEVFGLLEPAADRIVLQSMRNSARKYTRLKFKVTIDAETADEGIGATLRNTIEHALTELSDNKELVSDENTVVSRIEVELHSQVQAGD